MRSPRRGADSRRPREGVRVFDEFRFEEVERDLSSVAGGGT